MHIFIEINLKCANINNHAVSKVWDSSMWKGKTSSSHILSLLLSHFNHTVLLRPQNMSAFPHVSYMRKFFFKVIFLDSLTMTLILYWYIVRLKLKNVFKKHLFQVHSYLSFYFLFSDQFRCQNHVLLTWSLLTWNDELDECTVQS